MALAKTKKLRKLRRRMIKFFGCDITYDINDARGTYTTSSNKCDCILKIEDIQNAIDKLNNNEKEWRKSFFFGYKICNDKSFPYVALSLGAVS